MGFLWGHVSTTKGKVYTVLYLVLSICAYFSMDTSFTLSKLSIWVFPIVIFVITFLIYIPIPSLIRPYLESRPRAVSVNLTIVILFFYLYYVLFLNLAIGMPSLLAKYYGKDVSYEGFVSGKQRNRFHGAARSYELKIGGNNRYKGDEVVVTYGVWKTAEKGQMLQIHAKSFLLGRKIISAQLLGYDQEEVNYFQDHGMALHLKGKYDLALSYFDKVIELSPHNAKAFFNKGVTYFRLKQYDKAIFDYNRAIEIDPQYAKAYSHRGRTYALKGELEQACSDLNTGCKLGQCDGLDWAKDRGFCK
jgi:tetratricopeptide (TPR) repeat protein